MKYLALVLLPTVFIVSCLGTTPQQPQVTLMSHAASELPRSVYDAIAGDITPTNANKNAIMVGVRDAINALPRIKNARDKAIAEATAANGGPYPILTVKIIAQVDIENPIIASLPQSTQLTSVTESQLPKAVYDEIAAAILTNENKNKIMADVRAAIDPRPPTRAARKAALAKAVDSNNGTMKLASAIIAQIDSEDPILMTQPESALPQSIYDDINNSSLDTDNKLDLIKKNNIMMAVKAAMAADPTTLTERTAAIAKAVQENGDLAGLADKIVAEVDVQKPLLFTQPESGLPQNIFDVIYDSVLDITKKNQVIVAIKADMQANPGQELNAAIVKAVGDINDDDLMQAIIVAISGGL